MVSAAGGGDPDAPGTLSNLEFWVRGSSLSALNADDEIATWNDESGNGHNVTGVVSTTKKPTYRPTDGPSSTPAVRMCTTAGVGGYFTLPNFLNGVFGTGNGFVVARLENDPPGAFSKCGPPMGDWGSAGDDYYPFSSDGIIYDGWGSNVRKTTVNPTDSLASWHVYEVRSASGAWSNHLNGTQLSTTASNSVAWNTAPYLGFSFTNTKHMEGWIAEVIFYSRILDETTERKAVIHQYLNDKYGFALPT